jgi:hypothetical protein
MIHLDDFLRGANWERRAASLARPLREAHAFPPLHQLGIVAPDVEQTAVALEASGFGPFCIARGAPAFWYEKGRACRVSGKMGLAYHHGLEIELLEPLAGSAFYRDALDPCGRPVVHHLGFLVDDVDAWAGKLWSEGIGIWVRGQLKTGPVKTDFVYMEPTAGNGPIMEFISWKLFDRRIKPGPAVAHTIGRIQKWTGKRCLSL